MGKIKLKYLNRFTYLTTFHLSQIRPNKYLFHLELEFVTPECHLHLIGQSRGILGHPKGLYDTMLNLNEQAVTKMGFSKDYDPFGLIKQTFIKIHTSEDFVERFDRRIQFESTTIMDH